MTENRKTQLWHIVQSLPVTLDERMHYISVFMQFSEASEENDACFPVAMFHDLVEDGYISMEELAKKARLTAEQVAALEAITRKQGERYFDYIERVKKNEIARKVKLADLTHNIGRCAYDLPNRWGLIRRYAKAYGILIGDWKEKEARGEE